MRIRSISDITIARARPRRRGRLANQMGLPGKTPHLLLLAVRNACLCVPLLTHGEFSFVRLELLNILMRIEETTAPIKIAFAAECS